MVGPQGIQGIQGIQGDPGAAGSNGTPGQDGRTVLNGTVVPTTAIGVDGDFYINVSTMKIYGPKLGTWPATGTPMAGTNGSNGLPGTNGATVLNGTLPPLPTTGANGDFYINVTTKEIYGPKTLGAWAGPT